MRSKIKYLLIITLCVFFLSARNKQESYKVYFVPLDFLGYSLGTPAILKHDGMEVELDSKAIGELFNEIENTQDMGNQKPEEDDLKVYIIRKSDNKEIFITNKKIVLYKGKRYSIGNKKIDNAMDAIVICAKKKYKEWSGIKLNEIRWY